MASAAREELFFPECCYSDAVMVDVDHRVVVDATLERVIDATIARAEARGMQRWRQR